MMESGPGLREIRGTVKQERKTAPARRPPARPPGEAVARVRAPDIAGALRRVLTLCERPPPPGLPKRLDALFRELQRGKPPRGAEETGDLIWALWTDHAEPAAVDAMHAAIGQIVAKEGARARATLDGLCERYPDWAEAWNKRATLAFMETRDADAVDDIVETLAREPRHYGALAGFGQIAMRQGHPAAALAAYERALALNPHLAELSRAAEDLRALYAGRPN
jgi:tetratricopeptide (TPR) repeat protein